MLSTLCGSHLQHSAVCSPRYLTHSQMMAQTVNQLGLLRCATQGIKTKHLALLKCSNASSQASEHQANFRSSFLGTVPQAGHSQGKSRLQQAEGIRQPAMAFLFCPYTAAFYVTYNLQFSLQDKNTQQNSCCAPLRLRDFGPY